MEYETDDTVPSCCLAMCLDWCMDKLLCRPPPSEDDIYMPHTADKEADTGRDRRY